MGKKRFFYSFRKRRSYLPFPLKYDFLVGVELILPATR